MKLSIVTLVSAGYEEYFKRWYESTKNIKVECELIAVDNRPAGLAPLPRYEGVKIVTAGENLYQWAGRRLGAECAIGDYIWFTDCDDELLPLTKFDYKDDLICCNYMGTYSGSDKVYRCTNPYIISYTASETDFFHVSWKDAVKNMVWNKFIRKDVLMRVYDKIPHAIHFSFMEDTLLNILLLSEVKSIRFTQEAYYKYYFGTGMSTKKTYDTIGPLINLTNGIDIAFGLFMALIPEELQNQSGIHFYPLYMSSCLFFIRKYEQITPELWDSYTEILLKYFSKECLSEALNMECKEFSNQQRKKVKRYLNTYII